MKNLFSFFMFVSLSFFMSCQQKATPTATENGKQYFGEKISADNAMTYDAMLAKMSVQDSMEVKVKGTVSGVCQAKGCWMTIVSAEEGQPEMFVKFKDYGFFMPLDLAGSEVVMEGKAFREETSVDELRHYAEDEGQSAEEIAKITEPVEELKFMAHGVVVVSPGS